jgi:hypothetical protein
LSNNSGGSLFQQLGANFLGIFASAPAIGPNGTSYYNSASNTIYDSINGTWTQRGAGAGGAAAVTAWYNGVPTGAVNSGSPIAYPTKQNDTNNAYNTSTGIYTVPVAGTYAISAGVGVSETAGSFAEIIIQKNGTTIASSIGLEASGITNIFFENCAIMSVNCALNDQITVQAVGNGSPTLDNSSAESWFSIALGSAPSGTLSLAAVGSSPNANAASLSGSVLNLQPFNSTSPGVSPLSGGGTTKFLRADATWAQPLYNVVIPIGTTWTSPSTITTSTVFKITLIGAGGGGPGINTANGRGSGAGGGAAVVFWAQGLSPSTGYTIQIGAGGSGGTSTTGAPANGTSTTITMSSITYTAGGGTAGTDTITTAGGAGGTATNTFATGFAIAGYNVPGQDGFPSDSATAGLATGGGGGSGLGFGMGGAAVAGASGSGKGGTGFGGGGSSGAGLTSNGGAGSNGNIFIEYWN